MFKLLVLPLEALCMILLNSRNKFLISAMLLVVLAALHLFASGCSESVMWSFNVSMPASEMNAMLAWVAGWFVSPMQMSQSIHVT